MANKLKKFAHWKAEIFTGALVVIGLVSSLVTTVSGRFAESISGQRDAKEASLRNLVELSLQYPDSRDILTRLGVVQWELGNEQTAKSALSSAWYLDPTNSTISDLAKSLNLAVDR